MASPRPSAKARSRSADVADAIAEIAQLAGTDLEREANDALRDWLLHHRSQLRP